MTKENRFNKEVFYINILIALLSFVMIAVGYQTLRSQSDNIRTEVENTANEFETRIKTGIGSVLSLYAAAGEIYKNQDIPLTYVSKVHGLNAQGDFALDEPSLSNLTGFGGFTSSKKVRHEMATSLALASKVGTSSLVGKALLTFQVTTAFPSSSHKLITISFLMT